jgi:HTH-type transcriptional regulator / antitoxin HigA
MIEGLFPYSPDYAVHPGEYLEEVLESRGIKKREFAERLGTSVKHVSEIINKKKMPSAELSLQFEKTLGISANIWNNLKADYELFQARSAEEVSLEKYFSWVKLFPVSDLRKLGFLPTVNNKKDLLTAVLNFFSIASPEQWNSYFGKIAEARYRKSKCFKDNSFHVAAWLRAGELRAQTIETKEFSKDDFLKRLLDIREMTVRKPDAFELSMKRLCNEAGVALVFIPEFKETHISGATCWVAPTKALIIMSLRYKSNDHFWFTFFHEAAHILLHPKKDIFIDNPNGFESEKENEANRFSRNILISETEYAAFVKEKDFFEGAIQRFAKKINIHPGIVVGRLQHDELILPSWNNKLKERFELKVEKQGKE